MTWSAFHHRGEVLRAVVDAADERLDGILPMNVPGVAETFRDELDLIGALHLRWHARLSGAIEQELMAQPTDLEAAVARAWATASQQLPGIRLILDRYSEAPAGPEMAAALTRANEREWAQIAGVAGLANDAGRPAREAGRRVVEKGRTALVAQRPAPVGELGDDQLVDLDLTDDTDLDEGPPSFVDRIKAVLIA